MDVESKAVLTLQTKQRLENMSLLDQNATVLNDRYPPSKDASLWRPVNIGSGAVVGGGATIVAGVNLGQNAVLGAGSTLTKDLPPEEVWAGNPAKRMMSRREYEEKGGRTDQQETGGN